MSIAGLCPVKRGLATGFDAGCTSDLGEDDHVIRADAMESSPKDFETGNTCLNISYLLTVSHLKYE